MEGKHRLVPQRILVRGEPGSRIWLARAVLANGKVARTWRVRRIKIVLGKRDRREMARVLERWDLWLAENGAEI
jgi:hypothetical protein